MIRSMTGFGRASFQVEGVGFGVEIRTVNHRHADLVLRMPRMLSAWDPAVRERLQGRFARGKVEVSVSLPPGSAPGLSPRASAASPRRGERAFCAIPAHFRVTFRPAGTINRDVRGPRGGLRPNFDPEIEPWRGRGSTSRARA